MKVMIELAVGAEVLQNNYHLEDLYQTTLEIYLPKAFVNLNIITQIKNTSKAMAGNILTSKYIQKNV